MTVGRIVTLWAMRVVAGLLLIVIFLGRGYFILAIITGVILILACMSANRGMDAAMKRTGGRERIDHE
jgi:purine-cytosine permease-like protein